MDDLAQTPLYELHITLGARMVPFAGYSMPVQYSAGVMKEHLHTRSHAGLFDVSHMGQVWIDGANWDAVARGFETLVPQDVLGLADGRQRYGFFTNDRGGIEDDLMFARRGARLFVVVNAACKAADIARMRDALEPGLTVTPVVDRALIAVQGPGAEDALAQIDPACREMRFMDVHDLSFEGAPLWVSRSGYSGEDGFEISVPEADSVDLCHALLDIDSVAPIGLGARDTLRLEAGLCLFGQDIDTGTTPIAANLGWAMQKVRRTGGARAGGYPGATQISAEITNGSEMLRVGLRPDGKAPMRSGVQIFEDAASDTAIGRVTSGGFGPSVGAPIAMGYVPRSMAQVGTVLWGDVRGKRMPLQVAALPFVAPNFKR